MFLLLGMSVTEIDVDFFNIKPTKYYLWVSYLDVVMPPPRNKNWRQPELIYLVTLVGKYMPATDVGWERSRQSTTGSSTPIARLPRCQISSRISTEQKCQRMIQACLIISGVRRISIEISWRGQGGLTVALAMAM